MKAAKKATVKPSIRKAAAPSSILAMKYRDAAKHDFKKEDARDLEASQASAKYRKGRSLVPFYSEYEAPNYGASCCFRYHLKGERHK